MLSVYSIEVPIDLLDMVVEADFHAPVSTAKIGAILREIPDVLSVGESLSTFFQGLSLVHISENKLHLRFRFSISPNIMGGSEKSKTEEFSVATINFVLHVVARIDHIHLIDNGEFPDSFREFIGLQY